MGSLRLTNIICVIHGTIQTGSKDTFSLSIDFNTYFFRNKVPKGGSRRAGLRLSIEYFVMLILMYFCFTTL